MDIEHLVGELLPIPIKFIWLLQLNIGCHQCAWHTAWGWWWQWMLAGHHLLLHCMKHRMPALDYLIDEGPLLFMALSATRLTPGYTGPGC